MNLQTKFIKIAGKIKKIQTYQTLSKFQGGVNLIDVETVADIDVS